MSNDQHGYDWQCMYTRTYPDGSTYGPVSAAHLVGFVPTVRLKSSVDTGSFTPNVYRVNPYSVSSTRIVKDNVSCSFTSYALGGGYNDQVSLTGKCAAYKGITHLDQAPHPGFTYQKQLALQKAYGNVSAALLELGVELGELRETLGMLRRPFKDLRDLCTRSNFRRTRRELQSFLTTGKYQGKSGKAALRAATSTWMEARYGVRPLLSSIGAIRELAKEGLPQADPNKIYSARSSVPWETVGTKSLKHQLVAPGGLCNTYADVYIQHKVKTTAAVQYRYTGVPSLASMLGLGWESIPEIAWELTRLSFVVDWFYGIGPWLGAMRYNPDVSILGNTIGLRKKTILKYTSPHFSYPYEKDKRQSGVLDVELQRDSYNRTVNESVTAPQWIGGDLMDLNKTIDLLIILHQNIKF